MDWSQSIYKRALPILLVGLLLTSCGGGDSVVAVVNGQKFDLPVNGVDVVAGGLGGAVLPGNVGVPFAGSSLSILINFNDFDSMNLTIFDIFSVQPGPNLIDQVNATLSLTFNGIQQAIFPGSGFFECNQLLKNTVDCTIEVNLPGLQLFAEVNEPIDIGF